jgi:hypothetical protein
MMFPHSSSVAMPRSDRPSAKGFDFTGQELSAGCIEGTTHVDFGSYMIRKLESLRRYFSDR